MPKYATGKHALAISDRSGLQFPWKEMVTEWTGAFVHTSEYEPKQPQLRPKTLSADSMSLTKVRPARTAFPTPTILPNNPFTTTVSTTVTVTQPNHNFSSGDAVRFRQVKEARGRSFYCYFRIRNYFEWRCYFNSHIFNFNRCFCVSKFRIYLCSN